uniref:Nuclear RNA export factor 2 (inferred by orthology to a D. melanogaster protein) n=1 Tax=Strongyloides venezuelensis TaxID=75913 RepID=A0A0K0FB09_STRVS
MKLYIYNKKNLIKFVTFNILVCLSENKLFNKCFFDYPCLFHLPNHLFLSKSSFVLNSTIFVCCKEIMNFSMHIPAKDRKLLRNTANFYFKDLEAVNNNHDGKVFMENFYKYKGFLKKTESYYIKITNVNNDTILNDLREYCDFIPLSSGFLSSDVLTFWVVTQNEAQSLTALSRRITHNGSSIIIDSIPGKYRIWNNLTEDNIKSINEVCASRYSPEDNVLDLTSFLHEDIFNNDESPGITLEKVDVVLVIAKFILAECPDVEKISFSSNHLHSLECLEPILHVAKKLHTIDISFNFIKNVSCFGVLKRFKFKEIFAKQFQSDKFFYLEDKCAVAHIKSILQTTREDEDNNNMEVVYNPKLNLNDFPEFSTHFQYEEHFLATDPIRVSFFNNTPSLEKAIKAFFQSYAIIFDDDDFEKRRNLKKFYRTKVSFSLCISPIHDGRGYQYHYGKEQLRDSRNADFLKITHNMMKPGYYEGKTNEVLFKGSEKTINTLLSLPRSKHDMSTFVYDITYSDENVVMFTVKGLANFGKTRELSPSQWTSDDVKFVVRNFVCSIQTRSVIKIVSELVTIYPSNECGLTWYRKSLMLLEPSDSTEKLLGKKEMEKKKVGVLAEEFSELSINESYRNHLIERLCYETKMIPKYSLRCLIDCDYDYSKALQAFNNMKDEIPKDAFDKSFEIPPF